MSTLRRLTCLAFAVLSFVPPALAGHFGVDHGATSGRMAPPEACSYDKARSVLQHSQMAYIADVPRTTSAYRFIVRWKGQVDGAMVSVFSCDVDIAFKVAKRQPWCAYLPGDKLQCPLTTAQ